MLFSVVSFLKDGVGFQGRLRSIQDGSASHSDWHVHWLDRAVICLVRRQYFVPGTTAHGVFVSDPPRLSRHCSALVSKSPDYAWYFRHHGNNIGHTKMPAGNRAWECAAAVPRARWRLPKLNACANALQGTGQMRRDDRCQRRVP